MRHIQARCTDEEYFLFISTAKYYGISLSDFIKKCLKQNIPDNIKLPAVKHRREKEIPNL